MAGYARGGMSMDASCKVIASHVQAREAGLCLLPLVYLVELTAPRLNRFWGSPHTLHGYSLQPSLALSVTQWFEKVPKH